NLLRVRYQGGNNTVFWTLTNVYDGNWHHIAVVSNNSTDPTTVYMDGVSLGAQTVTMASSFSISSGGLFLAQDQDSVGGSWDSTQRMIGNLDQVRIYSRALSATDVALLFAEDSPI